MTPWAARHAGPLHVVQVSRTTALLDPQRGAEPLARQLAYARELALRRPGSRMTVLVVGAEAPAAIATEGLVVHALAGAVRARLALPGALAALHRTRPVDVLATQTVDDEAWLALAFARRAGVPVVGQIHGDPFAVAAAGGLVRRRRHALMLRWLRWFHTVRVVGWGVGERLRAEARHGRIRTVPVPIVMPPPAGEAVPPRSGPPTVLYVGRLAREKNLGFWLRVAAEVLRAVPEARFELAGEGTDEPRLRALATRLGLGPRVAFRGFVPPDALGAHYRAAGVLLLTSRYEGFGRVAAEALAHGTPVVATRVVGLEDVVDHGTTGFLRPQGAVAELAADVVRLLRDHDLRARMGAAGERYVRRAFDPGRLRRAWVRLLMEAA